MMNLCWVDFIFLNEACPDFAIFTVHGNMWNLFVLQNLHVKWRIFQIDLLNIVTGSCCNSYILLWTNWFDFRPLYSEILLHFKMCMHLTLSVSHCLKCALLACPPQSRSRIFPLSLLPVLPGLMFYSNLRKIWNDLAVQFQSHVPAGAGPEKMRSGMRHADSQGFEISPLLLLLV